jgi:putative PIN family toxin of toxin-antitoxin system
LGWSWGGDYVPIVCACLRIYDVVYDVIIVLDTSVIVAALFSRNGASHALLVRALEGSLEFAVSVALALEYEDVLLRDKTSERSWASDEEILVVLDGLLSRASLASPIRFRQRPLLPDPGDEMIVECAMQAGAETIVTLNVKDFSPLKFWPNIEVLRPGPMLARLIEQERNT